MKRIQRKRTKGWQMPPNTKCITRPGKWGNPFVILFDKDDIKYIIRPLSGDKLLFCELEKMIEKKFGSNLYFHDSFKNAVTDACELFGELIDKFPQNYPLSDFDGIEHIACFCKEGDPCHGDEIIKRLSK